ncbi:uncharacterized protein ACWYII_006095 [Salvelinus alpinus]
MSQEGQKDHQAQQPPEPLPVHPAIIQKARLLPKLGGFVVQQCRRNPLPYQERKAEAVCGQEPVPLQDDVVACCTVWSPLITVTACTRMHNFLSLRKWLSLTREIIRAW